METIIRISEVKDYTVFALSSVKSKYVRQDSYDGYKVLTDRCRYLILIDNEDQCCEDWGYITSEDDLSYYIGSQLIEVTITDTGLNNRMLDKESEIEEGRIQFVSFVTNKGVFQLAVYNDHNGYYGHDVLILKNQTFTLGKLVL